MSELNINIDGGTSTKLLTAGKYCDKDIIITASGGGGGEYFSDSDLVFSGNCASIFANDKWKIVLEKEKGRVKINVPTDLSNFLSGSTGEDYSFITVDCDNTKEIKGGFFFEKCENIKKLPKFSNMKININQSNSYFYGCKNLTDVNEIINFFNSLVFNNSNLQNNGYFYGCTRLKGISQVHPAIKNAMRDCSREYNYYSMYSRMISEEEILNIPIINPNMALTYDRFNATFTYCSRLRRITFETNEDRTPIVVNWKSQTINLSNCVGYAYTTSEMYADSDCTIDDYVKRETDLTTFNEHIATHPNWFTDAYEYAAYDKDSAVETINSLPDTSAYLAANSGTNTIRFKINQGINKGKNISDLTEAEIAVAAAKGWTVSFTN